MERRVSTRASDPLERRAAKLIFRCWAMVWAWNCVVAVGVAVGERISFDAGEQMMRWLLLHVILQSRFAVTLPWEVHADRRRAAGLVHVEQPMGKRKEEKGGPVGKVT